MDEPINIDLCISIFLNPHKTTFAPQKNHIRFTPNSDMDRAKPPLISSSRKFGRAGDCAALGSRDRSWVLGGRAERSIVNATVTASFLWNAGNLFLGFREVSSPELCDKDF